AAISAERTRRAASARPRFADVLTTIGIARLPLIVLGLVLLPLVPDPGLAQQQALSRRRPNRRPRSTRGSDPTRPRSFLRSRDRSTRTPRSAEPRNAPPRAPQRRHRARGAPRCRRGPATTDGSGDWSTSSPNTTSSRDRA